MLRRFPLIGAGCAAIAVCLVAAPAMADVKSGVDAWARGDYRQAVEAWRGPAVAGEADAQFNLAQAYKLGRGVPLDPALAESWFRKAAQQGHIPASDNYGLALFQAGKRAEALPWLEKSASRGEPRAELVLGTMLFNGDGVTRDYPRAYALMTLASQDGLQSASETLAQMDQYITPVDRQRGTQLIQQYRAQQAATPAPAPGSPTRVVVGGDAPTTNAAPAPPRPVSQPTPVTAARPTGPGASYPVPGAAAPATATPARGPAVRETTPAKPVPTPPPRDTAPRVAAKPPAAAHKNDGPWRIQLGAFRDKENANILWQRVRGRLNGAQPYYVTTGGVTRLQAGGYPNRGAAQAACTRSGQPCVVVVP